MKEEKSLIERIEKKFQLASEKICDNCMYSFNISCDEAKEEIQKEVDWLDEEIKALIPFENNSELIKQRLFVYREVKKKIGIEIL